MVIGSWLPSRFPPRNAGRFRCSPTAGCMCAMRKKLLAMTCEVRKQVLNSSQQKACGLARTALSRKRCEEDLIWLFGRLGLHGADRKARVGVFDCFLGRLLIELAGNLELGLFAGNVDLDRIF